MLSALINANEQAMIPIAKINNEAARRCAPSWTRPPSPSTPRR